MEEERREGGKDRGVDGPLKGVKVAKGEGRRLVKVGTEKDVGVMNDMADGQQGRAVRSVDAGKVVVAVTRDKQLRSLQGGAASIVGMALASPRKVQSQLARVTMTTSARASERAEQRRCVGGWQTQLALGRG